MNAMSAVERRTAFGLSGIYAFRMLGLFLILPVFALHAEGLPGATPLLVGIAIGIYGLTQAALQIPFGILSDRLGRKPVILAGLGLFALGSVIAAVADDLVWIIVGRAVQGSGAVAAAIMALAADLTRESQRTKVMAVLGMTIGASFMLAMLTGPLIDAWVGVQGIFWLTAGLAGVGMALLLLVVPSPAHETVHRDAEAVPELLAGVLRNADLLRLDWGIFSLHLILTALFLALPLALRDAGLPPAQHAWLYLPVLVASVAGMVPFVILAERHGQLKAVFLGAVGLLALALLGMYVAGPSFWVLAAMLLLFFIAFNLLEAILPSMVSKVAPAGAKGSAMGVYSSSQFSGAFAGGMLGGAVHGVWGLYGVFLFAAGVAALWLLIATGMRSPRSLKNELRSLGTALAGSDPAAADDLVRRLLDTPGVVEAVVVPQEGVAYLKVDGTRLDRGRLDAILPADA
jgi:MFS family permease